jgi:2-polyprenyl-6-methoxyphenol hydroxylase-like FAD-dependent oxidoreductase
MGARASLALLEELFAGHLEGERLLRRPEEEDRLSWLSFRRVTNEKWHAGNVVLVGDAARTAHFSIGSGTRLAIQDVVALARCLSEQDLSDALQAYQAVRQSDISSTLRAARLSAQWFENIPRYIGLDSAAFCDLMLHRRSPWMPHLPPGLYHQLSRATRDIGVLQQLRRLAVGLYS